MFLVFYCSLTCFWGFYLSSSLSAFHVLDAETVTGCWNQMFHQVLDSKQLISL